MGTNDQDLDQILQKVKESAQSLEKFLNDADVQKDYGQGRLYKQFESAYETLRDLIPQLEAVQENLDEIRGIVLNPIRMEIQRSNNYGIIVAGVGLLLALVLTFIQPLIFSPIATTNQIETESLPTTVEKKGPEPPFEGSLKSDVTIVLVNGSVGRERGIERDAGNRLINEGFVEKNIKYIALDEWSRRHEKQVETSMTVYVYSKIEHKEIAQQIGELVVPTEFQTVEWTSVQETDNNWVKQQMLRLDTDILVRLPNRYDPSH